MSFYTVAQLKAKITPKLHGAALSKIATVLEKMQDAQDKMLNRIDPPDTVNRYRIDNAIFDHIYNYTCDPNLKGPYSIIDLRPISPRDQNDVPEGTFVQEFDVDKGKNKFVIETLGTVKTLRYSGYNLPRPTVLAQCDTLDASVSYSGDVQNVSVDTLDYVSGNAALKFDLSGVSGLGVFTFNLPETFDLTTMAGLGSLFEWLEFTDVSRFASLDLKWGIDAANYYHKTVTTPQGRTAFDSGAWNLARFDWRTALSVGSPAPSNIKFLQVTIAYSTGTAVLNNRIDSILAALGRAYEMVSYSNAIFKDATTGALKQIPTSDSDLITLDPAAFQIFMLEFQRLCVEELKGKNMGSDIAEIRYELEGDGRILRGLLVANRAGLYHDYIGHNPTQSILQEETYTEFDSLDGY